MIKSIRRFTSSIIVCAALALAGSARAQSDLFGSLRSVVLSSPVLLSWATANLTNGPIDLHGYIGTAWIDVNSITNAGGALTCTVETSPDTTNWTGLTNFALINSTSQFSYTNATYNSIAVSNNYLLPGSISNPVPATGFATPYLNYATVPYTNSGSGAVTITAKGVYRIGIFPGALTGRYLHIFYTPTGTSSNDFVSAVLTGRRSTEVQ